MHLMSKGSKRSGDMCRDKIMSSILDTLNLRFTSDLQVEIANKQKVRGEIYLVKVNNL